MKKLRVLSISFISVALAASLCVPVLSFASDPDDSPNVSDVPSAGQEAAPGGENADEAASVVVEGVQDSPADCVATIEYYENVTHPEPGIPPNEEGRYLLGTRTITGLHEGDVLNAWDYVADLKGFFFFDGWPATLTISKNPSDNVIKLFYGRVWDSSYTVNYYLMEGADLAADTWAGALAPEGVEFVKFASETFDNQPFGALVKGDAYEYQLDGAYVVDAYPPEIRVGTDADNSVINVLYVPSSTHLPDDFEIVEGVKPPSGNTGAGSGSDSGGGAIGDSGNGAGSGSSSGSASDSSGSASQAPSDSTVVPGDQTFGRDEFVALLPESVTKDEASELFRDFVSSEQPSQDIEVTEEMLSDTMDPAQAKNAVEAYNLGLEQGAASQNGRSCTLVDHIVCIVIMLILLIVAIVFACLYARERKINRQLRTAAPEGEEGQAFPPDADSAHRPV